MGIGQRVQIRVGIGAALVATAALLTSALVPPAGGAGATTTPKVPTVARTAAKYAVPIPAVTKAGKVRTPKEMRLSAGRAPAPAPFRRPAISPRGRLTAAGGSSPTGQPFYADGVDHVSAGGDVDQVTGHAVLRDYRRELFQHGGLGHGHPGPVRSWGFNNIGDYSDDSTIGTQMPFTVQLNMGIENDVFASSFVTDTDTVAAG